MVQSISSIVWNKRWHCWWREIEVHWPPGVEGRAVPKLGVKVRRIEERSEHGSGGRRRAEGGASGAGNYEPLGLDTERQWRR